MYIAIWKNIYMYTYENTADKMIACVSSTNNINSSGAISIQLESLWNDITEFTTYLLRETRFDNNLYTSIVAVHLLVSKDNTIHVRIILFPNLIWISAWYFNFDQTYSIGPTCRTSTQFYYLLT